MRPLIVATALLLASCGPPVTSGTAPVTQAPDGVATAASASPSASASASPMATAVSGTRPLSAGAVPDAGVLYVQGTDDQIYRYDGLSGRLEAVSGKSVFAHETPFGAQILGRHGSADLLRWDGKIESSICGPGTVVAIAASGSCAYRGGDGSLLVRLRGEPAPRVALPADWRWGSVEWSPDGKRLALTRSLAGSTLATRAHNALWLIDLVDGSARELYRPPGDEPYVATPRWSRDGIYVAFWQYPIVSASVGADGVALFLVHAATAGLRELGKTLIHPDWLQWSSDGRLAFVRGGGRESWLGKQIVVRERDGTEGVASAADRSALAPAWEEGHGRLAWVEAPSGPGLDGAQYMNGTGAGDRRAVIASTDGKSEIRCSGVPPGESGVPPGESPHRVVEGVRWSLDGSALLLLCRIPGREAFPLEVWLYRLNGTAPVAVPLVTKLAGGSVVGTGAGFGYYGAQPSLFSLVAWSRGIGP